MDKETDIPAAVELLHDLEVLTLKYQEKMPYCEFAFQLLADLVSLTYYMAPDPQLAKKLIEASFERGITKYKLYHE